MNALVWESLGPSLPEGEPCSLELNPSSKPSPGARAVRRTSQVGQTLVQDGCPQPCQFEDVS